MKKSKKTILAMAAAMVLSVGTLGAFNGEKQCVSLGTGYLSGATEGGWSSFWGAASNISGGICGGMTTVGLGAIYLTATTPPGWGYWVATGIAGL